LLVQVSFRQLLDVFFDKVDPTTLNRQGGDRGTQYRSGIYFHDEEQRAEAQQKIEEVNEQLAKVRVHITYYKRVHCTVISELLIDE
jgi:peptide methionine sulfoxide reductase MsrA